MVESVPLTRYIAHLDLDCFYVSVERIKNPTLIGKPVVVGGSPQGRGVVASASYEARAFGVRSAMPTAQALRFCPNLIIVRGDYKSYTDYSNRLYKRMLDFAPVVERASIDELYMDFTGCESLFGNDLPRLMHTLKQLVWDEFKLPCTIALASNKTLAKIAAGTVKPNGLCIVPLGEEKQFLAPLLVESIPGVGKVSEARLKQHGFRTIADLQRSSPEKMERLLGAHGVWFFRVANGEGSVTVHTSHKRKSISHEETFARNIKDRAELEKILHGIVQEVSSTLRAKQCKARTITLKIRYSDFTTLMRARTIAPTDDDPVIFRVVRELLLKNYTGRLPLRLLGVKLSSLADERQQELDLFADPRRSEVLKAVDSLRKKFGDDVIQVGST